MTPQKLPIDDFTEGDEWDGIPSILITTGPEGGPYLPPENPLELVTMRFKKLGDDSSPVIELRSDVAGQITIVSAANWDISIPAQIIAGLTAGKWAWRIRCRDTSTTGKPKTWLAGEINVLETV